MNCTPTHLAVSIQPGLRAERCTSNGYINNWGEGIHHAERIPVCLGESVFVFKKATEIVITMQSRWRESQGRSCLDLCVFRRLESSSVVVCNTHTHLHIHTYTGEIQDEDVCVCVDLSVTIRQSISSRAAIFLKMVCHWVFWGKINKFENMNKLTEAFLINTVLTPLVKSRCY